MRIYNNNADNQLENIVLFPFDDVALPLQKGVQLHLNGYSAIGKRPNIVLHTGNDGDPDNDHVAYYGTVIRVGDEFWMWYLWQGSDGTPDTKWFQRVCFAKSTDGYHWDKPDLGLVDYQGNKSNNLVDLGQGEFHVAACVVFYEPDDPDPARCFKMAFNSRKYRGQFAVAYSPDGLTWTESPQNPVGAWFEMAGGVKHNGCYHLSGQGGKHVLGAGRQFATFVSYDFENWSEASSLGLQRTNIQSRPQVFGNNAGEQIHLGAGLWNRGNVILGFYGMWDGHPSNDRRMTSMDIGLAVSHDALHYHEPIPNYPIVSAAEDSWSSTTQGHQLDKFPALMQGQGFENIGDETLFWYTPWPEQASDGIRVAVWQRDRLGYLQPYMGSPQSKADERDPHIISARIHLEEKSARVTLNVDGLSEYSAITVEILDEQLRKLSAYSGDVCEPITISGLKQRVTWQGKDIIEGISSPIRIRINFSGVRPEDIKLYAIYLSAIEP